MRNLFFLSLLAAASSAQTPTVTSVSYDSLSHSVVRIDFQTSASWAQGHIRYLDTTAHPGGVCTDGASGVVQATSYNGVAYPTYGSYQMVIGGLTPGHTYSFCPEVNATVGGAYSSGGASVSITMPNAPAVHPAPPIPPATFNTGYPSDAGAGQTLTLGSDCATLQACLQTAISAQLTKATTIIVPAGLPASAIGGVGPFGGESVFPESPDAVNFASSQVSTTNNTLTINNHGFSENQQAVFGANYGCLPGNQTASGTGFPNCGKSGKSYLNFPANIPLTVHVVDANTIQLYHCPDALPACTVAQGTLITFADAGSGSLRFAKWPRAYPAGPLHSIIVRTSTPDSQFVPPGSLLQGPPDGSGVPTKPVQWLSKMGNLQVAPGSPNALITLGDANTDPLTSNIRFVGLHLSYTDTTQPQFSGNPNLGEALISQNLDVSNIVWDRCYIHAPGTPFRTGTVIGWNGLDTAFVNNYISGLEAWHQTVNSMAISGSGNTVTIAPGSTFFGAGSGTLANNATLTLTGSQSGQNRLFLDFSMSGNTLNIVPPPGINVSVSGITNYHIVSLSGSGPSGTGTNLQNWFESPVASTSTACTNTSDFTANMNTAGAVPSMASGYPGTYDLRFTTDAALYICGVKFYKNPGDTATSRALTLQTPSGTALATVTTANEPASGWVQGNFATPYLTAAGTTYAVAFYTPVGPSQSFNFWRNTDLYVGGMHVSGGYVASNGNGSYSDAWPLDYTGSQPSVGVFGFADVTTTASVADAALASVGSEPQSGGGNGVIAGLGPGPYVMIGNFISAAGLPWHFDNSGLRWAQRGDYTLQRNYHFAPRYTFFGTPYSNGLDYTWRQPLEWKGGERIHIYGDIFDGSEFEGGSKAMIALQSPGEVNCVTDADLMYNTFKHGPGTLGGGIEYSVGAPMSCPPVRTRYAQNLSWDINNYGVGGSGTGWWLSGQIGAEDVIIDHNTDMGRTGSLPEFWDQPPFGIEGVQLSNNFLEIDPTYGGLKEDATGLAPNNDCASYTALAMANCRWTPSWVMRNNVLYSGPLGTSQAAIQNFYPASQVPAGSTFGNYMPSNVSVAALGFFQPQTSYSLTSPDPDLHLRSTSPWCSGCGNAATDGADLGANVDLVLAQQGRITSVNANPTGATTASITLDQPDTGTCTLDYGTEPTITSFARISQACTPGPVTFNLTGLTTQTLYYYRYNGAVQTPIGQFKTR